MTELSKMTSDSWRNLSDDDKAKWKRLYYHQYRNSTADKKDLVETTATDQDSPIAIKLVFT
ncbi:hypothetical protein C1645_818399 [Glomus cerebriforme]|uniref:Uncharacterized protein n=1 Tax=Glomus cerebriforme TaxID=658196 RepID=A0A397TB78_9GLOM|nr:hypothetical protein C1645_818399 [Glomus cerebriforme]